ncbi:MAG: thioredoxin domain-containing protein, partial [Candidatus Thermoplasmatota archaeon]|nr:thioredoxin domain-containing protein [Candidatus Thermoplasmatota archaeon]MBU1940637.1 thioredoxin domain-containing protein [Candidatus Thermoplasmatota archaeon]
MTTSKKKPNHLIHEKSPYLQQHINNPVDWYPWGETAFTKAKQENKPIFLSIGYATCHWCHVMAHESFEDPEVAHLLNSSFICVKVDREERPDIDNIYMTICQLLTGSGGWPLTIIMTPTKKPFFAATYLPKETTYNIKGLLTLIPEIQNLWEHKTEDLKASAQEITNTLQKISQLSEKKHTITSTILDTTYSHLLNSFDEHYGGFGNAPKFPTPHQLLFLLRYWKRTKNIYSLKMVEITLEQMRKGGIYDHVGYGFHRYATDRKWIIPHFEKMLYDQALLIIAYTAAYQATKKPLYKKTVQELIDYVLREMTDSHHGFYSAEDADSEGQEGKFYTWQYQELKQILTPDEFKLATKIYNIEKEGNFNHHIKNQQSLNILYQTQTIPETVKYFNKTEHEIQKNIETLRRKLFHHR